MNLNNSTTPLSDVLYEFSLAQEVPDAELLDQFVRRFPEHATALTDLAINIVLDAARGDDSDAGETTTLSVSPAVSRAMSQFGNRLFAVQRKESATPANERSQLVSSDNPFLDYDRSGFRALVGQLHGNAVFVGMLRDRQIDSTTMTPGFEQFVADEMKVPRQLIASHFAAPAEMQSGPLYKADDKPHIGKKVSFQEAVRSCGLTDEQQRFLLSL